MKNICIRSCLVFAALLAAGCCSERYSVVPMVPDVGDDVATRYRYRIAYAHTGYGEKYDIGLRETVPNADRLLAKYHPRVFSSSGIPIVLYVKCNGLKFAYDSSSLGAMLTIGLFPFLHSGSNFYECSVEMANEADGKSSFEVMKTTDSAESWVPTSFLFYNGDTCVDGRRVFSEHSRMLGDKGPSYRGLESMPDKLLVKEPLFQKAVAYALAVKLKEMEDFGIIDAMLRKKAESRSSAPAHSVVGLDRDPSCDFAYSFVIELAQTPRDPKAATRAVLLDFMKQIKDEYLDTYPGADASSLKVSITGLKEEGVRISGRAAVLTMKPVSLSYDANARRGKLAVKFNPGQLKDARAWAKKNVRTLARDRNIALVTGQIPPDAKYYSLGETVKDGNILEIEFKTE